MMSGTPKSFNTIRAGLTEALVAIEQANKQVAAGKGVDLAETVRELDGLCEAAVALPPPEGRQLEPLLCDLIASLNRIADTLRRARAAAGGGDHGTPADHRAASQAYREATD